MVPERRERGSIARKLGWLASVAFFGGVGCRSFAPAQTAIPEDRRAAERQSPAPLEASNKALGERIELAIPLFEGGNLELNRLRGRVVVLELSASWEPGWKPMHVYYGELIERHGRDKLAIIEVALDPDTTAFETEIERGGSPAVIRGWDPMGALAARLEVARFPSVFVLDAEGRILEIASGYEPGLAARIDDVVMRGLVGQ